MACSCEGSSCNCLERCCCASEFCVCTACFNLRRAAVVKNDRNKPLQSVSNASSDSQKTNVAKTDCHLKDEELIQISSSCDELESDVVFIGSYDINRTVEKCSSAKLLFPEIVLSGSDYEPVFTDEENDIFRKITPENINSSRNIKGKEFCHYSNKDTISRRKRSWNNHKSYQNSYQGCRKKDNISSLQNRSSEQHEDIVVLDDVIENSNFNLYFSVASSSHSASNAQKNEATQESAVSNIGNNSLEFETNTHRNENNVIENSTSNNHSSVASSSCSAYKSQENEILQEYPVSNIGNNSPKSETNRCIKENSVTENTSFNRYFSERFSSWNVYNAEENKITQETPVSNIRNDSLELETNRCGLFTHKFNFNSKKRKCSWNNSRSAQNGKKMLSEMATCLLSEDCLGQQTDLTAAMPNVIQTKMDGAAKSSTFRRNPGKNFPDVSVHDFDEKDIARNLSDQGSLTHLKTHKRHVQCDNSGGILINVCPEVGHRGYTENLRQNIDKDESGYSAARKNKHVSFLLYPGHSSSEICNDYQESYRNSLRNRNESGYKTAKNNKPISFMNPSDSNSSEICNDCQESYRNSLQNTNCESGYKAAKNNKHISFMNPSGPSSSEICYDCQEHYPNHKRIRRRTRKYAKRRYRRKRTCPINEFTRETMSTSRLRHNPWRRKRNISCEIGRAAIGNKIKQEKVYVKRKTKNRFVKTEINYIKREIKKEP